MMAEYSGFWDTNGTGDGTSGGFTEEKLRALFQMLGLSTAATQGVMKTYLNALAVTGTSSPVSVNTGGAIVYGFWYVNDTSTTVAVPTPASATRIDRIVLRASWASQTVRLVRVAGTEGAGAPALTQTANTTWDIPLAQASITTGGVITLTDQRVYSTGNFEAATANIANDAITTAKIAAGAVDTTELADEAVTTAKIEDNAIDDTKAGDRVPQFYRRQGGGTTNWSTTGTTNYTPSAVRMQAGMFQWVGSVSAGTENITFPVAFSDVPLVFVQVRTGINVTTRASANSTTLTVQWIADATITELRFQWLAIGPE